MKELSECSRCSLCGRRNCFSFAGVFHVASSCQAERTLLIAFVCCSSNLILSHSVAIYSLCRMKFTCLLLAVFGSAFAQDGNIRGASVQVSKDEEVLLIPAGTDHRTLSEGIQRLLGSNGDDYDCMDCECSEGYCDCFNICEEEEDDGSGKGSKSSGKGSKSSGKGSKSSGKGSKSGKGSSDDGNDHPVDDFPSCEYM